MEITNNVYFSEYNFEIWIIVYIVYIHYIMYGLS